MMLDETTKELKVVPTSAASVVRSVETIKTDKKATAPAQPPKAKTDAKAAQVKAGPVSPPEKDDKAQQKATTSFLKGYMGRECRAISFGLIWLVGGTVGDLSIPIFIGRVVDFIEKGEFDDIGAACLIMLGIIAVSKLSFPTQSPLWYSSLESLSACVP